MHGPPIELKTRKGLNFFFMGLLLFCMYQLIFVSYLLFIRNEFMEFSTKLAENDPAAMEDVMDFAGPICGISLVLFIGLLLILLGLVFLFTGRIEFGESHARNVEKGLILIIIGFIIGTVTGNIGGMVPGDIFAQINVAGTIVGSIFYALGFILLLKQLLDETGMKYLIVGAILLIIFSTISLVIIYSFSFLSPDIAESSMSRFIISLAFSAIIVIPWWIITMSFYRALKWLEWGRIKPQMPTYPPYPVMIKGPLPPPTGIGHKTLQFRTCPSCGKNFEFDPEQDECPNCGYYFKED